MKLIAFLRPTPFLFGMSTGTHNGYVAVPPEHPCYDVDYDDVAVDVHGGLTFAGWAKDFNPNSIEFIGDDTSIPDDYWVFGFDTCHYGDNPIDWNKEEVIKETLYLKEQLEKF